MTTKLKSGVGDHMKYWSLLSLLLNYSFGNSALYVVLSHEPFGALTRDKVWDPGEGYWPGYGRWNGLIWEYGGKRLYWSNFVGPYTVGVTTNYTYSEPITFNEATADWHWNFPVASVGITGDQAGNYVFFVSELDEPIVGVQRYQAIHIPAYKLEMSLTYSPKGGDLEIEQQSQYLATMTLNAL